MKKHPIINNQQGFTLVEIIAVLIILGILAAVAVPRYIDLEANAKSRAIDAAISELNGRESLAWADIKISPSGYIAQGGAGETKVWQKMNTPDGQNPTRGTPFLGLEYEWGNPPAPGTSALANGSALTFKSGNQVNLTRTASSTTQPGNWRR